MSDDVVIRVEDLSKKYLIGHELERERYVALRDVVARSAKNAWRKSVDMVRGREIVIGDTVEEFWALKDVSFEVKRGEVLGIIGRNGAGKSTLLKILSRITEPTEGRVTINGRVASLLEVGTGFHPELTGRENIYLNGAILGMTHAEIKRKFDEIVAFSEVEKFLDTPVKRYSSGMYVRLAFAVAAHLEPEILIVDEVLAVGDAEFQKKCLGKMGDVAKGGRTVLFVSHNLGALLGTCDTGIVLEGGKVAASGSMHEAARKYRVSGNANFDLNARAFEGPLRSVKFETLYLNGLAIGSYGAIQPTAALEFSMSGHAERAIPRYQFLFSLFFDEVRVLTVHQGPLLLNAGAFSVEVHIPPGVLRSGIYAVALGGRNTVDGEWSWARDVADIEIAKEWNEPLDQGDLGLINLPSSSCRLIQGGSSDKSPQKHFSSRIPGADNERI
jgi:ABC-type polysaccharide/polyol phosphate transport system ATPase subunit